MQRALFVTAIACGLLVSARAGAADTDLACKKLQDPVFRSLISAGLEAKLIDLCSGVLRTDPAARPAPPRPRPLPVMAAPGNVLVNDPSQDSGNTTTQSETSIAISSQNGTICVAFNDSNHRAIGLSRSASAGGQFVDQGEILGSYGDPSIVYRRASGEFLVASLLPGSSGNVSDGLGLWSTTDCQGYQFKSDIDDSVMDDKELIAVDNNPASPYYGRVYAVWVDFHPRPYGNIFLRFSNTGNPGAWSARRQLTFLPQTDTDQVAQGPWPTVAPNGFVYVAWLLYSVWPDGNIDIEVARSTNGGATWTRVASPLVDAVNPRDQTARAHCRRPALNGDVRLLASPQIAVGPDGVLHVVYSYDPDGFNVGDVIDVFYRRSTTFGNSWGPEVLLNDDSTFTDQWYPTLSVGSSNAVVTAWYDRRLDPSGNWSFDYFSRMSLDGGVTWNHPATRVTTESSDLPELWPSNFDDNRARCYHGDYDQQIQQDGTVHLVWADDRNIWLNDPAYPDGRPDPDVWFDKFPVEQIGFVRGTVRDEDSHVGLVGARIEAIDASNPFNIHWGVSEVGGFYNFPLPAGTYHLTASAEDYLPVTVQNQSVPVGGVRWRNFDLASRNLTVEMPFSAPVPLLNHATQTLATIVKHDPSDPGDNVFWLDSCDVAGLGAYEFDYYPRAWIETNDGLDQPSAVTVEATVRMDGPIPQAGTRIAFVARKLGSYSLHIQPWGGNYFVFWVDAQFGGAKQVRTRSFTPAEIYGNWFHLVGTYDGQRQRIYLNGELQATSTTLSGTVEGAAGSLRIGDGYPASIDGVIGHVNVYHRALTPTQVMELYQRTTINGSGCY